jgi:3-oxoacyl-[acyl-carrier protein] reductase
MITVIETWHIKKEFEDRVHELMQEMDNKVGPPAHKHPAFLGHATFLQYETDPTKVLVMYPWRSQAEAEELIASEVDLIADFEAEYCAAPREVDYFTEVPHAHDMEDEAHHGG